MTVAPSHAGAAVRVTRASLSSGGALSLEGRGALANAAITVSSAESAVSGRADADGRFKLSASGFRSNDCKARVSDGSTAAEATLSGCTPAGGTTTTMGAQPSTTTTTAPARSAQITPVSAELGPGYVGSDFTTFSSTTTTMTFSPDTLGPVQFDIIAGKLPAGLRLVDPNAGFTPAKSIHASVAGTPTTVEVQTFTVKATDANGLQATRTYTIRINAARTLDISPEPWPSVTVAAFTNLWIDGVGGVKPYRWAVTAGQLPPGMTLVQDNPDGYLVRITGTPTTAGTFTHTLQLSDAQGSTVARTLSVVVN
jgi:hypothetical protein